MKKTISDPYSIENASAFGDYYNEILELVYGINSGFKDADLKNNLQKFPIKEVQVRFGRYADKAFKDAIQQHPTKVRHINEMAKRANACTEVISMKPILNEIVRLIYGKDWRLPFPSTEFNPDLVSVKE